MSLAEQAIKEADSIFDAVFGAIGKAVQTRRTHAAWWYAYRSRRAAYARTRVAKRYWSWLARRSRAQMEANATAGQCCGVLDALDQLPGGGEA